MKARVKVRPSGWLNGQEWPQEGETVDLPEDVAKGMIEAGTLEAVKAAPAVKAAAKPAAKPVVKAAAVKKAVEKVEVRPASKADTETRKK
jgi:hypothetical protein